MYIYLTGTLLHNHPFQKENFELLFTLYSLEYVENSSISTSLGSIVSDLTYNVRYDANGGTRAPSAQIKYYRTTLTLSSVRPSRTGYIFLGWSTDRNAVSATYSPGESYSGDSDLTLYAVWEKKTYTVRYDANGGTGAPSMQTKYHGSTQYLEYRFL